MAKTARSSFPASVGARHVWLALLGVVAVAERRSCRAVGAAVDDAAQAGKQVLQLATDTGYVLRGAAMTVQERIDPALQQLGRNVNAQLAALRRGSRASGTSTRRRRVRTA